MTDSTCRAVQHGDTYKAYARWGCRCPAARRARKQYQAQVENGTFQREYIDATGTRRRVQALAAIGHGHAEVCARTGLSRSQVAHVVRWPRVRRCHADAIARVYEELSGTPAPDTLSSRQVRAQARTRGWPPPLAWDDDTIDDPNAKPDLGSRRARHRVELAEEARFLLRFGVPLGEVAKRLDVTEAWLKQLLGNGARAAA